MIHNNLPTDSLFVFSAQSHLNPAMRIFGIGKSLNFVWLHMFKVLGKDSLSLSVKVGVNRTALCFIMASRGYCLYS